MVVQIIGITPLLSKFCIKKAGEKLNPADTENSKLAEYNGTDFKCQYKYYNIFENPATILAFFSTIDDNT